MIHKIFSIYDTKAEAYLPPFILPNAEMAKRAFFNCVNSDDHQFGANPADYTLFCLGEFNDANAVYDVYPAPNSLGTGLEFLKPTGVPVNGKAHESSESLADVSPVQSGSAGKNSA